MTIRNWLQDVLGVKRLFDGAGNPAPYSADLQFADGAIEYDAANQRNVVSFNDFPILEITDTDPELTSNEHARRYLHFNSASPITVTLALNAGFRISRAIPFKQKGTGQVTFVDGGGVTINTQPGYSKAMAGQHAIGFLIPIAENEYDLSGTLEPL